MWQKIAIQTAIRVIPKLIEQAIEVFKDYKISTTPVDPPVKPRKTRKIRDTTKITKEMEDAIYQDWIDWKAGKLYIPYTKTQEEFVTYVNESYLLNKSSTVIMKMIRNRSKLDYEPNF